MWIRSQDKKILKNCEEFYIYSSIKEETYSIESGDAFLGEYSTEQKLLLY